MSYYEWGQHKKGDNFTYEASVAENDFFEIYFSVNSAEPIYTYFALSDFEDDLDLLLYKEKKPGSNKYDLLITSEEPENDDEEFFKAVSSGNYLLEIDHYENLDGRKAGSDFVVEFDAVTFYEEAIVPNDPLFADQWHLLNTGQATGIDDEDIRAPEAWALQHSSPNVVVGVIDSGIQLNHPDLNNNIWVNQDEIAGNNFDDDNNGYIDDRYGWNFIENSPYPLPESHGTHVAGIIGAEGNNGIGVAGVTWDVQLMSLDVLNGTEGDYLSDYEFWYGVLDAIDYAVENGADVINMSLGQDFNLTSRQFIQEFPDLHQDTLFTLQNAVDSGTTVVIAAGNEDLDFDSRWVSYPALYSEFISGVISVAAIQNTGDITSYTNVGSKVTIAAPGGDSQANNNDLEGILSTVPPSTYEGMDGTSMASPIVAGAVALMKAENPALSPNDVENILDRSSDKFKELSDLVNDGNYLNLQDAIEMSSEYQPTTIDDPLSVNGTKKGDVLVGGSGDDDLDGKKGNDVINGMDGEDILVGNKGRDQLTGGRGIDMFVIGTKYGKGKKNIDEIMDFETNHDYLYFEGKLKKINIRNVNAGTLITFKKDPLAILHGIDMDDYEVTKITKKEWYIDIF